MKKTHITLVLAMLAIATISCTKDEMPVAHAEKTAGAYVSVTPAIQLTGAEGAVLMSEIRTKNSQTWLTPYEVDLESLPEWISISDTFADHVNYTVAPNNTGKDRKGTFYIKVNGERFGITVEQNTIEIKTEINSTPIGVNWTLSVKNVGDEPVEMNWNKVQLDYFFNRTSSNKDLTELFEDRVLLPDNGYELTRSFADPQFECGSIVLSYNIKDKKYVKGITL